MSEVGDIDSIYFSPVEHAQGFEEIGLDPKTTRLNLVKGSEDQRDMLMASTPEGNRLFEVDEGDMSAPDGEPVSRFRFVVNEIKNKAYEGSGFVHEHETEIKAAAAIGGVVLAGVAGSIAVIRRKRAK